MLMINIQDYFPTSAHIRLSLAYTKDAISSNSYGRPPQGMNSDVPRSLDYPPLSTNRASTPSSEAIKVETCTAWVVPRLTSAGLDDCGPLLVLPVTEAELLELAASSCVIL